MDYILCPQIYMRGGLIGSVMNFGNFCGHFAESMGRRGGEGKKAWSGDREASVKPGLSVNTFYLDTVFTNPEFT